MTKRLRTFAHQSILKINRKKTVVMYLNIDSPISIRTDDVYLRSTNSTTYLGSSSRQDRGTKNDTNFGENILIGIPHSHNW
ncbi:hypothetical protein CHS0354_029019, partial [Potamilus streckersoni]